MIDYHTLRIQGHLTGWEVDSRFRHERRGHESLKGKGDE